MNNLIVLYYFFFSLKMSGRRCYSRTQTNTQNKLAHITVFFLFCFLILVLYPAVVSLHSNNLLSEKGIYRVLLQSLKYFCLLAAISELKENS